MDSEPPVDPFERRLRFACGLVFGAGAGFFLGFELATAYSARFWLCVAITAGIAGFLAMRFGDEFWQDLSNWLRWW